MKRSQINRAIGDTLALLEEYRVKLPRFAYWDLAEWRRHRGEIAAVKELMLGWDVTDYGHGKFETLGGVLFTIRNGLINKPGVGSPYAEKILVFSDGQFLPLHYHADKTEDIINRGGGVLQMRLYRKAEDGGLDRESDVEYYSDGMTYRAAAGEPIEVTPGNSVRLDPFVYHTFGAKPGSGALISGEVSKINDDLTDNYFLESSERFIAVEEDEPVAYPLCNEYDRLLGE